MGTTFFVASGEKASLFRFPGDHSLVSVDTSDGILRLSVLAGVESNQAVYLIRDNELMLDTQDIWDMDYSAAGSLRIWKMRGDEKVLFIDLIIKPDLIVIRRMNSSFNGKTFRVRKLRTPQRRQIQKISHSVAQYEDLYREIAAEIDSRPQAGGTFGGINIGALIKQTQKENMRIRLEQELTFRLFDEFKWEWHYYMWVLNRVLEHSAVFGRDRWMANHGPSEIATIREAVAGLRTRYENDFAELDGVVAEYDGVVWLDNTDLQF